MGQPFRLGHLPQAVRSGVERVALIQNDRRADHKPGHDPVPHHPAAGGKEEQPVLGAHITMQPQFLGMLQGDAANAVNNAFGRAGGAAGIEDIERVVEPDPHEIGKRRVTFGLFEQAWLRQPGQVRCRVQIGDDQRVGDRRHAFCQLANDRQPVEALAAIKIAVAGDQQLRLDLAETVAGAADAEIRRTAREDGADSRCGQHRNHRFGNVRDVGGDTVALSDARLLHPSGKPHDARFQRGLCQAGRPAVLAMRRQGESVIGVGEHVFGIVQRGVGEEPRARHRGPVLDLARALVADHTVPVPEQVPEFDILIH